MKRSFLLILCLLLSLRPASAQSQQAPDSLRLARLDSLLVKFYSALERDDNDRKTAEFNYLIASCKDSLTRQHVAMEILDHYSNHVRVMGEEAVAIALYDKWVASGLVKPRDEWEQMNLDLFASFNRNSLVGMQAPKITLRRPGGGKELMPAGGRVSVIFFYDTSCGKCRLESQVMPMIINKVEFPLDFYAVYAGTDRKQWRDFRKGFRFKNRNVKLHHLWDPEIDSDYQRMYGVTGTPRLFVVLEDGEIIGRKLEVDNLQQIFHYIGISYGKTE